MDSKGKFISGYFKTGTVRLSYCHLFEPFTFDEDEDKKQFSCAILIPKDDKETLVRYQTAFKEACEEARAQWGSKSPKSLANPLHDGDTRDDAAYRGHFYLNLKNKRKPDVLVPPNAAPTTDRDAVVSGDYAKVTVRLIPYDVKGSKGISARLGNILFVEKGEPLAGGASGASDFEDELSQILEEDVL
jgi:hypothetical protein